MKGSKDIKRTTQWAQKSGLTLTFEHVTLKINRDHLLIEINPCTKFGIDQLKGLKDIERTTHGLQTYRPTDHTFFKGGIIMGFLKLQHLTFFNTNPWLL